MMDDYWNSYFKGDLDRWGDYLLADYKNIGTTQEEIWNSKEEILSYTKRILPQIVGHVDLRNKQANVHFIEPYIMVHEFGDLHIKTGEDWHLYAEFRLSSLLKFHNGNWKIWHQHGSFPDSKVAQGEAFAFNEVVAENKKLQAAVLNRTHELEAKSRELEIEAALERVRARSMAMQSSDELGETAHLLYQEMIKLGVEPERFVIGIDSEDGKTYDLWGTEQGGSQLNSQFKGSIDEPTCISKWHAARIANKKSFVTELSGKELTSWILYLKNEIQIPIDDKLVKQKRVHSLGIFSRGFLIITTPDQLPSDQLDLLERFAAVFDQTYTRFLDLEKAERQAREAQIEAALERIRATGMAMHHTSELQEVINTVAKQTHLLEMDISGGVFICINDDIDTELSVWGSGGAFDYMQKTIVPYLDHPIYTTMFQAIKERKGFITEEFSREEKILFFKHLFNHPPYNSAPSERLDELLSREGGYTRSVAIMPHTSVFMLNHFGKVFSDADNDILQRVGRVFEQSYVRFRDLQKAEAQVREAQIEAALERVRARAMAMRQAEELSEVLSVLFTQFDILDIRPVFAHLTLFDEENETFEFRMTGTSGQRIIAEQIIDLSASPEWVESFETWKNNESNVVNCIDYQREDLPAIWEIFSDIFNSLPAESKISPEDFPDGLYTTQGHCKFGYLGFNHTRRATEEEKDVVRRFANEFGRVYQRFLDLQLAEKQTHQSKIEAALERVRARALAMQEPEELKEVASVLRQEMGQLGVEELETCSIYINDEKSNKGECWYALKDIRESASTLVSDYFELDFDDTWVGREMLKLHRGKENQISILMSGENRLEWIRYCEKYSPVIQGYYGEVIPDRTYHLYKFSHGAIGAAAAGEISEESWDLLHRTASVFSLAYSRFKDLTQARIDLQHLKEEKHRAEEALQELKSTQTQLIHAEKMASLGELTAGIAHEIQNPLNFVNNFSEVSQELLDEMKEELTDGNYEEVDLIAQSVIQNLGKITEHGKRADGIVKGMLQHSRSSQNVKEKTDVNVLADEYLRLAYHGLRAKDKSFNANFKTDLDPDLPKINIIPQEVGRVILNLINNAFYACTERSRSAKALHSGRAKTHHGQSRIPGQSNSADSEHPSTTNDEYRPLVTVRTMSDQGAIRIEVTDNGSGIPADAVGKIFQPFFTTKPTGLGTGLGLSLSYDIITKGHEGELRVTTSEGEGTTFVIVLPISD